MVWINCQSVCANSIFAHLLQVVHTGLKLKLAEKRIIHGQWTEWRIATHKPLDPLNIISLAVWLLFGGPSWLFCATNFDWCFCCCPKRISLVLLNHVPKKHWGPLWVTWPAKSQRSLMPLTLLQDSHLDHMVHFRPLTHRILDMQPKHEIEHHRLAWGQWYIFTSVHGPPLRLRHRNSQVGRKWGWPVGQQSWKLLQKVMNWRLPKLKLQKLKDHKLAWPF